MGQKHGTGLAPPPGHKMQPILPTLFVEQRFCERIGNELYSIQECDT